MIRPSGRLPDEIRAVKITRNYTKYAEGSVLIEFGDTKVLCTASVSEKLPPWLRSKDHGWITAEYGMLPRSTNERNGREASRGQQGGRTLEIQRLIGRSLRSVVDLKVLGQRIIVCDCDVIQADGGTRTASITGAYVALVDCINQLKQNGVPFSNNPLTSHLAAISVGIYKGSPIIDLDYIEDSQADADMNVVMTENNDFVEIQGTAEKNVFSRKQLDTLLSMSESSIAKLINLQKQALAN